MTVRERPISQDDVLYALVVWKYYAVFAMVRACVVRHSRSGGVSG